MEVKVGIQHVTRELTVDTDATTDEVLEAFATARRDDDILTLTDTKGGQTLIRAGIVAYLDLGKEHPRKVGFGSHSE